MDNKSVPEIPMGDRGVWENHFRLSGANAGKRTYETIQVKKLSPALGAEISGVDLTKPLGNQIFQEVHDALVDNQVIFFRDQDLSYDQHKQFGRRFGALHVHPVLPGPEGHPEILMLHSDEKVQYSASAWHSDVSFEPMPNLGAILLAKVIPEAGGDTEFASMHAAYEGLSDQMQRFLCGLEAEHASEHVFGRPKNENDHRPESVHPVIRTHPVSGRHGIFVNSVFTTKIVGMKPKESTAVLEFLYRHVETPEFHVRFKWERNSIAFWDNRSTQHRAIADYFPQTRTMQRITINGDDAPAYRPRRRRTSIGP
ncbi:MAG: TauD/TfdA family dioxygenase, partial [Alphaproteobacteria bacterium]|nr:TauD/TfdA family dioxygenase [Alphaproteobacteria bacterium]